PTYNAHLPSFSEENYARRCCTICKPQLEPNSAVVEGFSMPSSSVRISDHESIAVAVALGYISE
ncbi:4350_t:CDS:2, partial [Gigaspora rosea]